MRTTSSKLATVAAIAAATLLAACNNEQAATTAPANTTEVTPAETETSGVSDGMVTNIDAAAPTGGEETEPMPAETNLRNDM